MDAVPRPRRRHLAAAALASLLTLTACSAVDPAPSAAPSVPSTGTVTTAEGGPESVLVDVGNGRSVSVTCWGSGSPAVIYLHGMIMRGDGDEWTHARELQDRIPPETTYCEYARVNTGDSSRVEGPFPITDSIADLHGLIDGLGFETPVVLVGGSFGGLLAYAYAGTHPDDVAGVVLLDPTLHAEDEIEKQLLPEEFWLTAEAWQDTREEIDVLGAYAVARTALASVPAIPGTIFVTEHLEAPDPASAAEFRAGIRQMQADLIEHFEPSQVIAVGAPHVMLPVVPDRIAEEVMTMVDAAR